MTGEGSWIFGANKAQDKVEIFGSKGEIHFSVLGEAPIQLMSSTKNESLNIAHPKHLHQYHVNHMKQHFLEYTKHPSTGETGLHTSWVMSEILNQK